MDPIQKSFIQKTFIQGAAFGALAIVANTPRFVAHFPNLSKQGLLLTEGTLVASSVLHDFCRRQDPEQFHLLEKGALLVGVALFTSYAIGKYGKNISPLPPQLTLTATAATLVFSLIVTKISACSPLVLEHARLYNDPKACAALSKEEKIGLAKEFFGKNLPFIPWFIGLNTDEIIPDQNTMLESPQKYPKNQLCWLLGLDQVLLKDEVSNVIQYAIKNKIPIFKFDEKAFLEGEEIDPLKEVMYQLYQEAPIYAYGSNSEKGWLKHKDPLPTFKELRGALTPQVVEKMPSHIALAWHRAFVSHGGKFQKLDVHTQLAFMKHFVRMNLADVSYDNLITEIFTKPAHFSSEEHKFFREELIKDQVIFIISKEECQLILYYLKEGIMPPLFKIDYQIEEGAEEIDALYRFYAANPLYFYLSEGTNTLEINQKQPPIPSLEVCAQALTREEVPKLTHAQLVAWHAVLDKTSLKFVPPHALLALLQQFDALKLEKKIPDEMVIELVRGDMANRPAQYTTEEVQWAIDHLEKDYTRITQAQTLGDLSLLIAALKKGIDIPYFNLYYDEKDKDRVKLLLSEILQAKPIYGYADASLHIAIYKLKLSCPELPELIKRLTPQSIEEMTSNEVRAWHIVLEKQESLTSGKDTSYWDSLEDSIKLAFVKRFIPLDLPCMRPEQFISGDVQWLDLHSVTIEKLSERQLLWYQTLLFKGVRLDLGTAFTGGKHDQISNVLLKCAGSYALSRIVPFSCVVHQDRTALVTSQVETSLKAALKKIEGVPFAYDAEGAADKFRSGIVEKGFLLDLKELDQKEELFLRAEFRDQVVFPLTDRYVEQLSKESEDIPHLIQLIPKIHDKAEFSELTLENRTKLRELFGEKAALLDKK
ncbi:MAG: hypothetical protein H7A38_03990 [Chlamydiales bacterium]|nr:hypothetical protein [Chlamydiales bacterium]